MGRGGAVLGLIGIILGAGGIAFGYFIWRGQNNNLTQPKLVGVWDGLADNQDYTPYNALNNWLLEFGDNKLNNTDYISVSNTYTRIVLLKSGWYRIHLSMVLMSISPSSIYTIKLLKDGIIEFFFNYYEIIGVIDSQYHSVDSSGFVYSNGTNYIEINGESLLGDNFFVHSIDYYNQLTIEFVTL